MSSGPQSGLGIGSGSGGGSGSGAVDSVNGKTGNVNLTYEDVKATPKSVPEPTKETDATNKKYVDDAVAAGGGGSGGAVSSVNGQTGEVVLDANDVGALPDTTTIPDVSNLVPNTRTVNGNALDSDINLDASDVGAVPEVVPEPTKETDATNKKYVDDAVAAGGGGSGGAVSSVNGQTGAVVLDASDVDATPATVPTPTQEEDAANKKYVDDAVAAGGGSGGGGDYLYGVSEPDDTVGKTGDIYYQYTPKQAVGKIGVFKTLPMYLRSGLEAGDFSDNTANPLILTGNDGVFAMTRAGNRDYGVVSIDGGENWFRPYDDDGITVASLAAIFAKNKDSIIAADYAGFYSSADGCVSWSKLGTVSINFASGSRYKATLTTHDDVIYYSGGDKAQLSLDGGSSTDSDCLPKIVTSAGITLPDADSDDGAASDSAILIQMHAYGARENLYFAVSYDNGATWEQTLDSNDFTGSGQDGGYKTLVASGDVFLVTETSGVVYKSEDACKTWDKQPDNFGLPVVGGVQSMDSHGDVFVVGFTDGSLGVSYDLGATWEHITNSALRLGTTGESPLNVAFDGETVVVVNNEGFSAKADLVKTPSTGWTDDIKMFIKHGTGGSAPAKPHQFASGFGGDWGSVVKFSNSAQGSKHIQVTKLGDQPEYVYVSVKPEDVNSVKGIALDGGLPALWEHKPVTIEGENYVLFRSPYKLTKSPITISVIWS